MGLFSSIGNAVGGLFGRTHENTTASRQVTPYALPESYVTNLYNSALAQPEQRYYPAQGVAPLSWAQTQGINQMVSKAINPYDPNALSRQHGLQTIGGNYLKSNPVFNYLSPQAAGQGALSDYSGFGEQIRSDYAPYMAGYTPEGPYQDLMGSQSQQDFNAAFRSAAREALPGVKSQFSLAGLGGSPGMAQAETKALADAYGKLALERERNQLAAANAYNSQVQQGLNRGLTAAQNMTAQQLQAIGDYAGAQRAAAGMLGNAYQSERGLQQQAAFNYPQLAETIYRPSERLLQAGGLQQQQAQNVIDEAKRKYAFNQQAPYDKLGFLRDLYSLSFGAPSTYTREKAPGGSPVAGLIGGGLGGYVLGNKVPKIGGTLGAVLGGLGGLLGA